MARFQIQPGAGFEPYIKQLEKLGKKAPHLCRRAVYSGGSVAVAATKKAWMSLPLDPHYQVTNTSKSPYKPPHKTDGRKLTGVTIEQKLDLIDCTGISTHDTKADEINAEVGVDGYMAHYKTSQHSGGVPALLFARSLEKGTSFREACPVVKQAVKTMKPLVISAMEKQLNNDIGKIIP